MIALAALTVVEGVYRDNDDFVVVVNHEETCDGHQTMFDYIYIYMKNIYNEYMAARRFLSGVKHHVGIRKRKLTLSLDRNT